MGQILDVLGGILLLLATAWALLYSPVLWLHLGRQKPDAGRLLLGVVMPRRRPWYLGSDILVVVMAVSSSCLIVANWVWTAATGLSTDYVLPFIALFSVLGRMYEWRPLFSMAPLEIREQGILYMGNFWPWAQVQSYSWTDTPEATLRPKCVGNLGSYRIAPEQQADVDTLLRQNLPSAT